MWSANGSMLSMPNSAIISRSRSEPLSLQAIRENRSPSTCTGSRTFARTIASRSWFTWPSRASGMIGTHNPSSYTCLPSGPKPRPPMSTTCTVDVNSPPAARR